ncbi:regulator of G-protein signaling 3-like [Scleropages formosus]|uniref:regulator of G-protein signaling 3-like n=1 Tax=Scleropages formosus TaxID=113540 RepID=UPI0010FA9D50|nr:regulator of G-protein signaling 3-like [Scleropages formosus]
MEDPKERTRQQEFQESVRGWMRQGDQARVQETATKRRQTQKTNDFRQLGKKPRRSGARLQGSGATGIVSQGDVNWETSVAWRDPGAGVKVATVRTSLRKKPLTASQKRRKISPSGFRGKGKLKLSITPENGLLFIHVIEARGLMAKEFRTCNSYVKMVIVPDSGPSNRQKTKMVPDCKNPVFHKTFVFQAGPDHHDRRLLVTVWNHNRTSRRSEFLGCMSFGIHSLITLTKEISGWYYLLGEELGKTKHLKVASRRLKPTSGKK